MSNEEEERGFKITDRRGQPKEEKTVEEPKAEPKKEAAAEEPKKEAVSEEAKPQDPGPQGDRPVDFSALIFSVSTSAMISMGLMENPQTKKKTKDVDMARQQIDVLEMLQVKTKGNLTETEEKFLTDALYQLRMAFVEVSK